MRRAAQLVQVAEWPVDRRHFSSRRVAESWGRAMTRTISMAATTDLVPAHDCGLSYPDRRRGRLLASSVLNGGTLRCLAAAAGMMTALGVSPAFAQCYSTATGLAGDCTAVVPTGGDATAFGASSNATGTFATAIGANAHANGTTATATGESSFANGSAATATGDAATADGALATATGQQAHAIGDFATATGQHSTANGTNATATGQNANATGDAATATGANSNAIGDSATATGVGSNAIGGNATATGAFATANGFAATATGVSSTAIGENATATGRTARANGANATATGQGSTATGATASAFGQGSTATGDATTAIGQGSTAGATGASAIGQGATANFANSTAIGVGATTTAANQMSFGTLSNTYRMSGITSAASLAAQSGPTQVVTTDAAGHLAAASFSGQDISLLQSNVTTLQTQMKQAFEGTAVAIAMGGSALPSDKKFAISTNWGTFRGQNAMSLGAQMRLRAGLKKKLSDFSRL
jgi:hypothetical protein